MSYQGQKTKCCKDDFEVVCGGEGTCHYRCVNCGKPCDVCQKDFCSKCVDDHICGEKEQEEAEYNAIHEGEDNGTFSDHLEEIKRD